MSIPHLFTLQDRDQHQPNTFLKKWMNTGELSLSQQLLSKYIRCSRQTHEGLDISPVTLCRQKATSGVPAGPVPLPGVNQLHTHWTCFDCVFPFLQHFCWGQQRLQGLPGVQRRHVSWDCQQGLSGLISFFPFSLCCREARQFLMSH